MLEPASDPLPQRFSDNLLYEIHITRGAGSLKDVVTYQFQFTTAAISRVGPADLTQPPGGGKELFAQISGATSQTYTVTRVQKKSQTVLATGVPVAPPRIGPRTQVVLKAFGLASSDTYDEAYAATFIRNTSEGGRVWAGPRDEGEYRDSGGIYDLLNFRPKGTAQDALSGFNCYALALTIPANLLTTDGLVAGNVPGDRSTVGVWASVSRKRDIRIEGDGTVTLKGPWVQVARRGLSLVSELFIGVQDKDHYNASKPADDLARFGPYCLNPVLVRDAEAVGTYSSGTPSELHQLQGLDPDTAKTNRLDILEVFNLRNIPTIGAHSATTFGDVLRVDLAVDSAFPNGHPLGGSYYTGANANREDDVTDIMLSLILAKLSLSVTDGVDHNDAEYLTNLPWLHLPWQGYNQGHGELTP